MNKECVYCGRPASTVDHVPPKVCFPKPRPRLITVPACDNCNNRFSKDDEEFASLLSLRVGIDTPIADALHQKNRRIVSHNRRILDRVLKNTKYAWAKKGGVIVGKMPVFHWAGSDHDRMIRRIIRALFFHVFQRVLPVTIPVQASWSKPFDDPQMLEFWSTNPGENIGDQGQFRYRYLWSREAPDNTLWMLIFYDRHFATGRTGIWSN